MIKYTVNTSDYDSLCDPARWANDVRSRVAETRGRTLERPVLFLGSSSFVMWDRIEENLGIPKSVNHSFGGSTVFDILYYLDELVLDFAPSGIVICSGDNDLFRGRRPVMVACDYHAVCKLVWNKFPDAKISFISIKPSQARWEFLELQQETNERLQRLCSQDQRLKYFDIVHTMCPEGQKPNMDLFLEDGLHLSEKGYGLWREGLRTPLQDWFSN